MKEPLYVNNKGKVVYASTVRKVKDFELVGLGIAIGILLGVMGAVHYLNKPICDDLVRSDSKLLCTYNLGAIQEDDANVRIK